MQNVSSVEMDIIDNRGVNGYNVRFLQNVEHAEWNLA